MKNFIIILAFLIGFCFGGISFILNENLGKKSDEIIFKWEGLKKDIPEGGDYIQITGTSENIVYLNAIDE